METRSTGLPGERFDLADLAKGDGFRFPEMNSLQGVILQHEDPPEIPRGVPLPGPPRWFVPTTAALAVGMLAMAAFTLYEPNIARAAPRDHVRTSHAMASRGLYLEFGEDSLELTGSKRAFAARAAAEKKKAAANGMADLSGFGGGPILAFSMSPMQASAAKREASFLDLSRQVRRGCGGEAQVAPTSVSVRAHIVVGKNGSASEVSVDGNSSAVAACVAREIRAYRFSDDAASVTTDLPFSWRKQ